LEDDEPVSENTMHTGEDGESQRLLHFQRAANRNADSPTNTSVGNSSKTTAAMQKSVFQGWSSTVLKYCTPGYVISRVGGI
jgi:hypothetical protein